jgi:hypothetical protein
MPKINGAGVIVGAGGRVAGTCVAGAWVGGTDVGGTDVAVTAGPQAESNNTIVIASKAMVITFLRIGYSSKSKVYERKLTNWRYYSKRTAIPAGHLLSRTMPQKFLSKHLEFYHASLS